MRKSYQIHLFLILAFRKILLRSLFKLCLITTIGLSTYSFANSEFLPADQAFQLSSESVTEQQVKLNWNIAPDYYLYHDQFKISAEQKPVHFQLPKGQPKDDPTFGLTQVHYHQVNIVIDVRPNTQYKITWQGCAKDGLCYPPQSKIIETDASGLLPQNTPTPQSAWSTSSNNPLNTQRNNAIEQDTVQSSLDSITNAQRNTDSDSEIDVDQASNAPLIEWNNDQSFFKLLSKESIGLNLLIFFILGILLAFLPCSLPLIPILSTIIIQRNSGYKAAAIALSFVISMALVYSLMGIFVAEIGYSFQRWFQNPIFISLFALLFVIFALNLFGLFQLSLPQALTQRLNQVQNRQKAGTIVGAGVMGALSALIIGPCMSAPLAGALLFVSQSHSAVLGGLYLLILGLGIGVPLFIASVFGTKLLPKPGLWMNHLKVCFGFLMLMMAVYFIRPMLSTEVYAYMLGAIGLVLALYLIKVIKDNQKLFARILVSLIAVCVLCLSVWQFQLGMKSNQIEHLQNDLIIWNKVTTSEQLKLAMNEAHEKNKIVVIDVYADWCVACQPLEREVFTRTDVQEHLQHYYLIKLDLSHYNASQDLILKDHEILGPPTLLLFQPDGQEIRNLRLTGTFKANELIQVLDKLKTH
ncbi:protein-disulfide reductase DsbD [Acinetobacter shaoyimingii]|uniref:Protein-disulfide reductase DsbD n=1 Tax=Acinetobacter shaoyimingii TaxID=2715164 RepID=A0A6G8RV45_9GAMM|nr:protein-disulfide reductase DsbD [Acinetobacter shaoyimingii]QIO05806.1 protein-disulfide reductase DsbD [Acinetobacter shaoyimingii]